MLLSDYNVPGQHLPHTGFDFWPLILFAIVCIVCALIVKARAR